MDIIILINVWTVMKLLCFVYTALLLIDAHYAGMGVCSMGQPPV